LGKSLASIAEARFPLLACVCQGLLKVHWQVCACTHKGTSSRLKGPSRGSCSPLAVSFTFLRMNVYKILTSSFPGQPLKLDRIFPQVPGSELSLTRLIQPPTVRAVLPSDLGTQVMVAVCPQSGLLKLPPCHPR
jgi:hypothetical protein